MRSGRVVARLSGHAGGVNDIEFGALDLDDLIAIARRRVTRGLTAAECRQYLRERACR